MSDKVRVFLTKFIKLITFFQERPLRFTSLQRRGRRTNGAVILQNRIRIDGKTVRVQVCLFFLKLKKIHSFVFRTATSGTNTTYAPGMIKDGAKCGANKVRLIIQNIFYFLLFVIFRSVSIVHASI